MRMVHQRNMVGQINKIRVKKNMVENLIEVEEIILGKILIAEVEGISLEEDPTEVEEIILGKNLTEVEEIILGKNLIEVEEIILGKNLIEVEEIILEEDLTVEEESQPTKKAADEVTRIILLINLGIRAIETVIENHLHNDNSI